MRKTIDNLEIGFASIFELEEELREHANLQNEAHKAFAVANKEVNELVLAVEVKTAEVVDKICREEDISPSARAEVRRSRVALNKEWQALRWKLNRAIEKKDIMEGLSKSWEGRGFRLSELAELAKRLLWNEPRAYDNEERLSEEERWEKINK